MVKLIDLVKELKEKYKDDENPKEKIVDELVSNYGYDKSVAILVDVLYDLV